MASVPVWIRMAHARFIIFPTERCEANVDLLLPVNSTRWLPFTCQYKLSAVSDDLRMMVPLEHTTAVGDFMTVRICPFYLFSPIVLKLKCAGSHGGVGGIFSLKQSLLIPSAVLQ